MTELILIIVFVFLVIFYGIFLGGIIQGLAMLKSEEGNHISDYISIIIPFRNESGNILQSLESIEKQNLPKEKFEVLYVNDSSEDDSLAILTEAKKSANIKILNVPKVFYENAHKKRAVKFGIENSKGEIIVTTDADCLHASDWLETLTGCFDEKTGFVSGPVEFIEDGSFFGGIQKLEFAGLILAGAGLIGRGTPVICNGANIAYRRKCYEEAGGFSDHINLSSGEDELLMQKIAGSSDYSVKFCHNRRAVVKTAANRSLNDFFQQRKRWASKGIFYADKKLIMKLIIIFLFYAGIPAQLILGFAVSSIFFLTLGLSLLTKFFLEFLILKRGTKMFFPAGIMKYFLASEIFQIPYIILAGAGGLFGNFIWKERKLKR